MRADPRSLYEILRVRTHDRNAATVCDERINVSLNMPFQRHRFCNDYIAKSGAITNFNFVIRLTSNDCVSIIADSR